MAVCSSNYTTIDKVCVYKLNKTIEALKSCRDSIEKGERIDTEKWSEAASNMNDIINALANHWYITKKNRYGICKLRNSEDSICCGFI